MNDNERFPGEDLLPEENSEAEVQQERKDIFSPVTSRDVYSYTKDQQAADAQLLESQTKEESAAESEFTSFEENPFESFPKNTYTEPEEPTIKAEEPAFNPYAAPKRPENNFYAPPQSFGQPSQFTQQPSYNYNQQSTYPHTSVEPPKKSGGKKALIAIIAVCIVVALGVITTSLFGGEKPDVQQTTLTNQNGEIVVGDDVTINAIQTTSPSNNLGSVNSVFVADKVRPSVVGVMVYSNGQLAGEGSGILWGEDATHTYTYVVTCAHVIDEPGVTYGVLLLDGKTYEAEMVATDTRTDIGVLKIKATGLPLAEIGDSSSLRIGEPIYAIGNPGGSEYFGSITDGIVSAIDRSVSATYTMTCIQHNAAINPGNSGGALVNTAGQIVGINSSKIASTDFEGMGFAVPTSIAQTVAEALIKYGYVPNRPKLGIQYAEVSAYQLYSMVVSIKGLPQGSLVIAGISADSSLANTKAEVGDLIIAVNGKDMNDSSVLLDLIDTGAVGDTLTLTLCRIEQRTYKTSTFDVTIKLVEDRGDSAQQEVTTTQPSTNGGYYYGGAGSFEDFFEDYFGFGW
jgi:serine protease Do